MKSPRTRHTATFKAKVALAAIREQETIPAAGSLSRSNTDRAARERAQTKAALSGSHQ